MQPADRAEQTSILTRHPPGRMESSTWIAVCVTIASLLFQTSFRFLARLALGPGTAEHIHMCVLCLQPASLCHGAHWPGGHSGDRHTARSRSYTWGAIGYQVTYNCDCRISLSNCRLSGFSPRLLSCIPRLPQGCLMSADAVEAWWRGSLRSSS